MNKLFQALSDQTRREILEYLNEKDMSAGEIAEKFNTSKPAISHHLNILKNSDLVTSEKKGQNIVYSLNSTVLQDVVLWIYNFKERSTENEGK